MSKMTLSEELQWRGFVNQTTFKDITELNTGTIKFYWGVDPSAPSMTIGNLAAAMMVRHFIAHGHQAYLLIGGATGMIGDPDGKSSERTLKPLEEIQANKDGIVAQYKTVFNDLSFDIVDNYDWFKDMGYLQFLREVGKHVPMRQMLGRDFVQTRLQEGGAGISYAEFSYVLIQGYDFLNLYKNHDVTLQLCGSDQWGNSIAGVDLIRRIVGGEAHVWSTPLVINKTTGQKFGKSESGAIWLDEKLTPVYDFYQFWLNVDDEGVEDYLKIYTLLDKAQIEAIITEFGADKASRLAQKTLAFQVTKIVHGAEAAESAKQAAEQLFGNADYASFTENNFENLDLMIHPSEIGSSLVELLVDSGLASSNTEARRFLNDGAIYINDTPVHSGDAKVLSEYFVGNYFVLRRGKNSQVLVKKK